METGILYIAVFEGDSTKVFRREALPQGKKPDPSLTLYISHEKDCLLLHDMADEQTVITR